MVYNSKCPPFVLPDLTPGCFIYIYIYTLGLLKSVFLEIRNNPKTELFFAGQNI